MTLMKRDSLRSLKRAARKMDFDPGMPMTHALLDHGLAALDRIEELESEIRSMHTQAEETRIRNERLLNGVDLSDPYFE